MEVLESSPHIGSEGRPHSLNSSPRKAGTQGLSTPLQTLPYPPQTSSLQAKEPGSVAMRQREMFSQHTRVASGPSKESLTTAELLEPGPRISGQFPGKVMPSLTHHIYGVGSYKPCNGGEQSLSDIGARIADSGDLILGLRNMFREELRPLREDFSRELKPLREEPKPLREVFARELSPLREDLVRTLVRLEAKVDGLQRLEATLESHQAALESQWKMQSQKAQVVPFSSEFWAQASTSVSSGMHAHPTLGGFDPATPELPAGAGTRQQQSKTEAIWRKGKEERLGGAQGGSSPARGSNVLAVASVALKEDANALNVEETCEDRAIRKMRPIHRNMYHVFDAFIWMVILLSFVNIGVCHQWYAGMGFICGEVEHVYTGVFLAEALIKLQLFGSRYYRRLMNFVDLIIVAAAVIDVWVFPALPTLPISGESNLIVLRIFRLARLLRAIKVMRMKRELYVLAQGILGSLKALFWIMILLVIVLYVFAIMLQDLVMLGEGNSFTDILGDVQEYPVPMRFSRLTQSMLTLYSMCIGGLWLEVVDPVSQVQPFIVPILMGFIALTSLGLLNVIIGIITEQTALATLMNSEQDKHLERMRKVQIVKEVSAGLGKVDENGNTIISPEELRDNRHVAKLIQKVEMPKGFTLQDLYMMLDVDGSQTLDPDEFVEGMVRCIESHDFKQTCMIGVANGRIMMRLSLLEERLLDAVTAMEKRFPWRT